MIKKNSKKAKTSRVRHHPSRMSVAAPEKTRPSSYEKDFYKWVSIQASLLKKGHLDKLDAKNLIEELKSLGRSEKREIYNRLIVLLSHLLKCRYQSSDISNSWKASIRGALFEINKLLKENPSLKKEIPRLSEDAYTAAVLRAIEETNIAADVFPKECPWLINDLLNGKLDLDL